MGKVAGRGDGVDVVACDDLTDSLHTAKAPGLLRLFAQGLSGGQRISATMAGQGTPRCAP